MICSSSQLVTQSPLNIHSSVTKNFTYMSQSIGSIILFYAKISHTKSFLINIT
jgi:hypothetical protein